MAVVAISGATGFIGRHLIPGFTQIGWTVVGLCRRPEGQSASDAVSFQRFDLSDLSTGNVDLRGVDVLVHCAVEPYRAGASRSQSANVDGSRRLFETARAQGVQKVVFFSSIAARDGTSSTYGGDKLRIEQLLDTDRDLIIRPGLVIGDGGIFRALYSSTRKFRVAPIIRGGRQPVYIIGIEDLGRALHDVIERDRHGTFLFASRDAVPNGTLYRAIGHKAGVEVRLIPLPYGPTLRMLEFVEYLGMTLPISSSSLKGVRNMRPVDFSAYQYPEVAIRPFAAVMNELQMSA
jgi:nucleoside-diphosphate-sugar epimerase